MGLTTRVLCGIAALSICARGEGQDGTESPLARMPAVSATRVAFVYAGDIWVAPKTGGVACRLSTPPGEESAPRFSPDGERIAFTANYEGNDDVYVMPVAGGEPVRVTFHGATDQVCCWWPDGASVVFGSRRESFTERVGQFFKIASGGGLAERLPIPYGEGASVSPDGKTVAYTSTNIDGATWKRYRGGLAPDILLYRLDTGAAEVVARDPANDWQPMWAGADRLYFLSDRGEERRFNLWRIDLSTGAVRQVTRHADVDVRHASAGPSEIVYEIGGRLRLLDLASESARDLSLRVTGDRSSTRARVENVSGAIRGASVSPSGKRVVFEARGDLFSVPAEQGVVRNLTASQGVAERYPSWSPDGRWIAYFSDRGGEYELALRAADGAGEERFLTRLGAGFRYRPSWSPDSKKILFIDCAMRVWLHDIGAGKTVEIDRQLWHFHGSLEAFRPGWSADGRWVSFAVDTENRQSAIVLFDTATMTRHRVTSAFYDDDLPAFDPAGRYLYYRSRRNFRAVRGEFDNSWTYANGDALVCVPLRVDLASPLAPREDREPVRKEGPGEKRDAGDRVAPGGKERTDAGDRVAPGGGERRDAGLRIDIGGFESRGVILPVGNGQIDSVCAVAGKVIYRCPPPVGSNLRGAPVWSYDIDGRSEKRLVDDAASVQVSADGKTLLVSRQSGWVLAPVLPPASGGGVKTLVTSRLEMVVEPELEWGQIFRDAWRLERDYFYDPGLHGVDWAGARDRYQAMLGKCATRHDVNFVLGELLGELGASHTYRTGGDLETGTRRPVGYLGCDYSIEQGAVRVRAILETAPWDTVRSPLREPGVGVRAGDWLLAVNGCPVGIGREPAAAFQGLAEQTVALAVNSRPSMDGAREVLVRTLASESDLRQRAWVETNRRRVDAATGGRAGYIYVRDTGDAGQTELFRQWRGQVQKRALVIDERWNAGGKDPDRFIELLTRRVESRWRVRDGRDWTMPQVVHDGPKAMLANAWSGSGGDNFAYLFRRRGLGPLIGTRTWGGLIGITGCPGLIDGGSVTVPTFRIYDLEGRWIIEGEGVRPDIEVADDAGQLARGIDPQLERAIAFLMEELARMPERPREPARGGEGGR